MLNMLNMELKDLFSKWQTPRYFFSCFVGDQPEDYCLEDDDCSSGELLEKHFLSIKKMCIACNLEYIEPCKQ